MDNHYSSGSYMPMNPAQQHNHYASYPAGYSTHHQQQQQQHQHHPHHHQQPQPQQQQQQQDHSRQGQDQSRDNSTLPPLHTPNNSFGQLPSLYNPGSHPHTPTTAHAPGTSSMSSGNIHAFSHSPATSGSMLPPSSSYASYPSSQAPMPPSSMSTSGVSALASTAGQVRLPDLRPIMPQAGYNTSVSSLPSFGASNLVAAQPFMTNQESEPTHVVGSQGRRGILPSAPGRAQAPTAGTAAASTKSMIPAKDADGKFPCPHCNKTYLHAKHLKRHLLRHTGDRPYMCHLCKDTFSRSDILKRHFQKCSIRRGNPTGANHLAHQRRNTNGSNRLSISQTEPIGLAGMPEVAGNAYTNGTMMNGANSSPTVNGDQQSSYASSVASMSNRSSRANSLIHPNALNGDSRHNLTGMGIPTLASNAPNGEHVPATSSAYNSNMPSYAMRPQSVSNPMPPNYSFGGMGPSMSNGNYYHSNVKAEEHTPSSYTHQQPPMQETRVQPNGVGDWSSMFSANGQDAFMTQSQQGQHQAPVKAEGGTDSHDFGVPNGHNNENFFSGLYSHPSTFGEDSGAHHLSGFPNWNMDLVHNDPLQSKADALLTYVFSNRTSSSDDACDEMRRCLTVDNIKHFIEQFTSFQGHWPIIHMPTFDLMHANNGLVLTIICVGAVYSDKRDVYQVRQMMELVRDAVNNSSRMYNVVMGVASESDQPLGSLVSDIEEIQAMEMLATLFIWHGNQSQRAMARQEFGTIVAIAKRMGLVQPVQQGHLAHSILHQPGPISQDDLSSWNWASWIEQEKRSRVLFAMFLMDTALVMYFNCIPHFDPLEIRLPLPADDAAWDAKSIEHCRDALGLNGSVAQSKNITGSQRPRQPDMRSAMRSLMDPNYNFQTRATNAYSKFILIHALHVQIWKIQRAHFQQNAPAFLGLGAMVSSGPSTPLSQNDWVAREGSVGSSVATPTDSFATQTPQAQSALKAIHLAMTKWKMIWDNDMNVQYPPHSTTEHRFGFSRDGIHFYYLGQSFLRSTKASDWTSPPDIRFMQVMTLLKRIKGFVVNDQFQHGNGVGVGSVGDIDDTYGIGDLTLDMRLLFRKIGSADSPIVGVRTDIL